MTGTGGARNGRRRASGSVATDIGGQRLDPGHPAMEQRDPEQVPRDLEGEPCAGPHPRPSPVAPADRHDIDPVATSPSEVDKLDVEDDAGDLLPREQVVRGFPREALEPALRVLHRAVDPGRREEMDRLAKQPAPPRRALAQVGSVRVDAAPERDVAGFERPD